MSSTALEKVTATMSGHVAEARKKAAAALESEKVQMGLVKKIADQVELEKSTLERASEQLEKAKKDVERAEEMMQGVQKSLGDDGGKVPSSLADHVSAARTSHTEALEARTNQKTFVDYLVQQHAEQEAVLVAKSMAVSETKAAFDKAEALKVEVIQAIAPPDSDKDGHSTDSNLELADAVRAETPGSSAKGASGSYTGYRAGSIGGYPAGAFGDQRVGVQIGSSRGRSRGGRGGRAYSTGRLAPKMDGER